MRNPRRSRAGVLFASAVAAACASGPTPHTLAGLRDAQPDLAEVPVGDSLDQAIAGYRKYLEEAPKSALTPEAMRRLADLKIEQEYGLLGDGAIVELPAPEPAAASAPAIRAPAQAGAGGKGSAESDAAFEQRASAAQPVTPRADAAAPALPEGERAAAGPLEAIALYDRILAEYPTYRHRDQVLYQKARALDELGRVDEAIAVIDELVASAPRSRHLDEVHFRRAEYFFTRRRWLDAERGYAAITAMGPASEYYELALYKLGWALYKQDLHEEALAEYVRLLDHKVASGYDFEQTHDEDSERRIADTFRVISLSFSNLGGPESVAAFFAAKGERSYEDRIYARLGEFYFEKLRYDDAAKSYKAFVALHPLHRASPLFGMRVVEIYEAGGFPKLVLEAKKEFAASYGLESAYWRHFDVAAAPEVRQYLKANLADLASHHHALFQDAALAAEKPANYEEALRWYRAYLASFPAEPESGGVNHRLADLLLEREDFAGAAREYERTAYEYGSHERAAAAGYAAIYAHREAEKRSDAAAREGVRREAVRSTLRFVEKFPQHEQAASVLGVAVRDLYEMKEFAHAIATGRRLIDGYPEADPGIRRSAWTAVAHSAFELGDFGQAEQAYGRVLEATPTDDAERAGLADNLAAAIYKQGEQADAAGDAHAAADHFLRIGKAAPSSSLRPAAEYDAAAALIRAEDWAGAAPVLEAFRSAYPEHELAKPATQQLALVYRKQGDLPRAAGEYERIAAEAEDPALRGEALLAAGELYESAKRSDRALAAYLAYVGEFPRPVEVAAETRFKIASMYEAAHDAAAREAQLHAIVALDAEAGSGERSARVRTLAARAALVLAEATYRSLAEVALVQPFDQNLKEKQRRLDAALAGFSALVDYEVGDVTAAATFYMAESYADFGRALRDSERPLGLEAGERDDYEAALEDEALRFEERAIALHEKNRELLSVGEFNPWIEKSLARLAALMPGRYAKAEESSGYLDSVDAYSYQAPRPPVAVPAAVATQPAEAAPSAEAAGETAAETAEVPPPANAAEEFGEGEAIDAQF